MDRRTTLTQGVQAPAAARRWVSGALRDVVGREDVETVTLVVSELVTNAVVHAGTAVELHLVLEGRRLRLRVLDGDQRQPVPRRGFSDELTTGRGLRLLEVLTTRWGVEPTRPPEPPGKAVWCELTVSPTR